MPPEKIELKFIAESFASSRNAGKVPREVGITGANENDVVEQIFWKGIHQIMMTASWEYYRIIREC